VFIIQKIISNILISPGIFIIALLLILFLSYRIKYHKLGKSLLIIVIIFTYLFSIEPIKDLFVQPLEKKYAPIKRTQLKDADVYIVLGGGIYDNAPTSLGGDTGVPTTHALTRVIEGVKLYKNNPKKIIISGGIVYGGTKSEGSVYKKIMVDLGVPSEDIIVEGRSKTTEENAKFSKEIMKKLEYKRAILITSATHMKRAVYIFEKNDVEVIPNPTGYISRYVEEYGIESYFPNSDNFMSIRAAIWEYIGLFFYSIK
jgi:uncharacterized SAM-binding protein YcdF (DUF218 family)